MTCVYILCINNSSTAVYVPISLHYWLKQRHLTGVVRKLVFKEPEKIKSFSYDHMSSFSTGSDYFIFDDNTGAKYVCVKLARHFNYACRSQLCLVNRRISNAITVFLIRYFIWQP